MKILKVKIKNNRKKDRFDLYIDGIGFVFDIPPCENVRKIFEELGQVDSKRYEITIKPTED